MVATGETVGLAEWIIDDTCLVFLFAFYKNAFWQISNRPIIHQKMIA